MSTLGARSLPAQTSQTLPAFPACYDAHKDVVVVSDAALSGGPLPGRDGLVHGLVDAEDFRQPGDPEDLQDPLLRADPIQRTVVGPGRAGFTTARVRGTISRR